jgi:hydrogenase nickel incorporation protein HypA/HybF
VHELSIAESIVGVASRHAGGRRVYRVDVEVGHLRQVVPSALEFAFELVAQGTPLEGAELHIESVPAAGVCTACGSESRIEGFPLTCSRCGGLDLEIVRGEELLVSSLELEEEKPARTRPSRALAATWASTGGTGYGD